MDGRIQIGVDIGGTFTDIVALDAAGRLALAKVPSTPKDLLDGIAEATTRVLALAGAKPRDVERFIHGTTIATNAILEQKGATTAILTTDGFEDVLELGRMKRSRMYDLGMDPEVPTFLTPRRRRVGIRERLDAKGGVIGAAFAAEGAGVRDFVSLDMGGTSNDVAVAREGRPLLAAEGAIGPYPVRTPMVDVNSIGAGGGSIAWIDAAGGLRVGPRSAGAEPGPACYGRGGA